MTSNSRAGRWIWIANTGLALGALVVSINIAFGPARAEDLKGFVEGARRHARESAEQDPVSPPKNMEFYRPIWDGCGSHCGGDPPPLPHPALDSLLTLQGLKENGLNPRRSCAFVTLLQTRETLNAYVGDTIEGAKVAAITGPGTVEFDYYGERVTLTLTR